MSLAAALVLAVAAAHAAPAAAPAQPDRGAQVESAHVTVAILRPAVIKGGALVSSANSATPRNQRQSRDGRVTYEFE